MKFLIVAIFIFISCYKKEEIKIKPEILQLVKPSEMSVLMKQMLVANTVLKQRIKNNETLGNFPEVFLKIKKAKLTEIKKRDVFFEIQSNLYLKSQSEIYGSKNPKLAFNAMVNNCITCHENKCPGPISRIKKLYIK